MSRWTYREFGEFFDGLAPGGRRIETPPKDTAVQGLAQPISSGGQSSQPRSPERWSTAQFHHLAMVATYISSLNYISSLKKAKSLPAAPSPWHLMQPIGFPARGIDRISGGALATVPFGLYLIQYQSPASGL